MGNYGKIDQNKLKAAARRAGISDEELRKALEERKLDKVVFSSGR